MTKKGRECGTGSLIRMRIENNQIKDEYQNLKLPSQDYYFILTCAHNVVYKEFVTDRKF